MPGLTVFMLLNEEIKMRRIFFFFLSMIFFFFSLCQNGTALQGWIDFLALGSPDLWNTKFDADLRVAVRHMIFFISEYAVVLAER